MLSVEVTTRCNLKCKNCFARSVESSYGDLSFEKAVIIAKEGRDLGYTKISITGGEPLIWCCITDYLLYLKEIGYTYILINSNLHFLTPELANIFKEYNDILYFSCSVNTFKEEHDYVRGSGSFNKVIQGLETALEYSLNVYIYSVINKRNLYSIPEFTKWLFDSYKNIAGLVCIQLRGDDNKIKLTPEELIEFVDMVYMLNLAGYNVSILENSLATVVSNIKGYKCFPDSPEISREGKIVILQNGNITDNHSSDSILGKYYRGILKEVLNSDNYKQLSVWYSKVCVKCKFQSVCEKAGKMRPSDNGHNVGDMNKLYCQKVLELVSG